MRRFFILLTVLILLAALDGTSVSAVSTEDIYKESGANTLAEDTAAPNLWESLWKSVTSALTGGADKAFKYGGIILGCILLISLVNRLAELRKDSINGTAMDFVSGAALAAACYPAVYGVFTYTQAAINSMLVFCASLLPVMASLYSLGGNPTQAVSASGGITLFLTTAQAINARLLIPLLSAGFAFALTGLLPGAASMAPIASFLKNCTCVLIAFVFSLVGFVFYFQTAVAATADNFSYRTVKFAAGAFIPIIGNTVGDSARTVFGAVSTVKASVGVLGICVVMGYLIPPLISAIVYKGTFSFCALFARLCGQEKQAKFVGELGSLLGASLALLVACGAVFTVISAVFLKSGATV